jgi:hypothetical protein
LDLGQKEVKAGAGNLELNIVLPAGYKFNREAPFYMRWKSADGSQLKFGLQADSVDFKKATFPIQLPVEVPAGRSELTIDTVVYYCTEKSTACLVDPIRVKLALHASPGGPAGLPIDIPVRKPAL